jgi:hypothetical protein
MSLDAFLMVTGQVGQVIPGTAKVTDLGAAQSGEERAKEATGDRRQDATLDKPWRNVSGVQQVIELEEKAKAQEDDELPYRPCGRKPVKPRGDCAHGDWKNCLEISINLSPVYGPLVLPLLVF